MRNEQRSDVDDDRVKSMSLRMRDPLWSPSSVCKTWRRAFPQQLMFWHRLPAHVTGGQQYRLPPLDAEEWLKSNLCSNQRRSSCSRTELNQIKKRVFCFGWVLNCCAPLQQSATSCIQRRPPLTHTFHKPCPGIVVASHASRRKTSRSYRRPSMRYWALPN